MTVVAATPLMRFRSDRVPCAGLAVALLIALSVAACAPRTPPPVAPVAPRFPDFLYPAVPADLARATQARDHDLAWRQLQSGDVRGAARAFERVARANARFYPAQAGLGWTGLAAKDGRQALAAFDRALSASSDYVPALVGRGEALLLLKREGDALASFEAALAVDPELPDVRRRVEVLRFRDLEQLLTDARAAAGTGRFDEARAAYARAAEMSPDSPLVLRELADVERRAGDPAAALEHAKKATDLDPNDPAAFVLLGGLLEAGDDTDGAIAAYQRALALDDDPEVRGRIDALRRRAALALLPQQYRDLPDVPRVTRGDLAALIGIRLERVLASARARQAVLVTDTRGHWAGSWITVVTRTGVMDPYPNHTFQPRNQVRRGDLAHAVSRVLAIIATRDRTLAEGWTGSRLAFTDLGVGHASHAAASVAVASGVMSKLDNDAFGAGRPVTGADAVAAVERLDALAAKAGFGTGTDGAGR